MQDVWSNRMRTCGGCRFARYCSERCQRADWAEHRQNCRLCAEVWDHKLRRRKKTLYGILTPDLWVTMQRGLRQMERARAMLGDRLYVTQILQPPARGS